jgi:hypothetical protein
MATQRSHAARFGIQFSLAMDNFTCVKIEAALKRTRISSPTFISQKFRRLP